MIENLKKKKIVTILLIKQNYFKHFHSAYYRNTEVSLIIKTMDEYVISSILVQNEYAGFFFT